MFTKSVEIMKVTKNQLYALNRINDTEGVFYGDWIHHKVKEWLHKKGLIELHIGGEIKITELGYKILKSPKLY